MFRVNQKVVCIDAGPDNIGRVMPLILHKVYTIAAINKDYSGDIGFNLVETAVPEHPLKTTFFSSRRFRPIVERKTDISIFTKMLADKRENIDA